MDTICAKRFQGHGKYDGRGTELQVVLELWQDAFLHRLLHRWVSGFTLMVCSIPSPVWCVPTVGSKTRPPMRSCSCMVASTRRPRCGQSYEDLIHAAFIKQLTMTSPCHHVDKYITNQLIGFFTLYSCTVGGGAYHLHLMQ